jgi:hypothetical protein
MKKTLLLLAALATASGCVYPVSSPEAEGLGSFRVEVRNISVLGANNATSPLQVVRSCTDTYGNNPIPADVKGTAACRYVIPHGAVELELAITALDRDGQPLESFNGPVSFQVVPGDLSGDYPYRWKQLTQGQATGKVRASHLYGEVRVWVKDEPPELIYVDGKVGGDTNNLPQEPAVRTHVAGSSAPLFFEEPTLSKVQQPEGYSNISSPFVGQFLTIGRAPESGSILLQSCADDAQNHNKPVTLLVTGTDPAGFFVTDITACKLREDTSPAAQVSAPEPSGYLPGSFASVFVYNYSFPEGLDTGDLLWALSGSVQEFTSTTQLTFPSWITREKVRLLPPDQWNKYLDLNPPVELSLRTCGLANTLESATVDSLCGYFNSNLKIESLESGLVKLRRVRFPQVFKSCDSPDAGGNGNGEVPFFCQKSRAWSFCGNEPPAEMAEVQCNIDCTVGQGAYANTLCSERTNYNGFGQFVVEMAGPGPEGSGLDDSLPNRKQTVALATASRRPASPYSPGTAVRVWCESDAHVRFGDDLVTASAEDTVLPARKVLEHTLSNLESSVAFLAEGTLPEGSRCYVAQNTRTRIQLMTRDAVPELRPDCDPNDTDADRAEQCKFLRGATFDVVGHLRHVQPGRPRWLVMPRDADDLCCHPGQGLQCPRPIKPCE